MSRQTKDMSIYREADVAKTQRDRQHGELRDLGMKHKVHIFWDLNEDGVRDQIVKLTVDDLTVYLDAEQLQRYLRWV